jgi:hypothetical protein
MEVKSYRRAIASILLITGVPVSANILVELSFQEKWNNSDLVIVGTVTGTRSTSESRTSSSVTIKPVAVLKGASQGEILVQTQSRIPEENPRCCELGATYMMFLDRTPQTGTFASVNGRFGLVRIGSATRKPEIRVHPDRR